ncbi:CAP domain-containing protein [Sulfitobacter aestuariivivens]|uniref:CAP domain-containing protein n=1 Tax=Sulfitobacter aestuariivivens TaxID=2766981 RepID=A0A927HEY2_9RHOB|nr:CAP domain-containing protein [Sulfitobacter aestuariivivens]MBD3662665.1 CAP domain-containing protein [Sulfitobacter aestuariivivens]
MKRGLAIFVLSAALCGAPLLANETATRALNGIRAERGLAPVTYSPLLEKAAMRHASDMARKGFFSHRGSDGSRMIQRIQATGYPACYMSENIAKGTQTIAKTMAAWTASPPHLRNMVNRKAREFGIARGQGDYWVIVLAAPC